MIMLEFRDVSFSYPNGLQVFERLSFELSDGELLAVMGASGCGKTTLLSLAAGLQKPSSGFVISSHQKISYVFQEPRLFPWMTVQKNVEVVLPNQPSNDLRVREILKEVGLEEAATLMPHELSGGMKSRVSLARAMAYDGDLFLLDEPFAALDKSLRQELAETIRTHLKKRKASAIFVTHQITDATLVADRLLRL